VRPTVSSGKDRQAGMPETGDTFASSLEGRAFGNHN
jgi:hypothetical protein